MNKLNLTPYYIWSKNLPEIGGEVVQNAAFTFINSQPEKQSTYIRLIDYKDSNLKSEKTLEAIQNPKCGWFYIKNQKDFKKIPGNNIGYWLSEKVIKGIEEHPKLIEYGKAVKGLDTCDNNRFTRLWFELVISKIGFNKNQRKKWYIYQKGEFRKWFGNNEIVVNWKMMGLFLKI